MTRRTLVLAALAALLPFRVSAQVPLPTPTPNYQVYDDPAMHFKAPAAYLPLGQRKLSLRQLTEDPQIVAGWAIHDPDRPKQIVIEMESYQDNLNGFDQVFEQQLRAKFSGIVRDKEHVSLKNGMPALFMTMTAGAGFSAVKMYWYLWVDGQRGVALGLQTQVGQLSVAEAKRLLADCTAVAYPNRDY